MEPSSEVGAIFLNL
jgi:hypothetical protein